MYMHINYLLDRSASMASIKEPTEGAFNHFVEDQRKEPGHCSMSLVQFDDQYETVYSFRDISEVPPLILTPRGSTSLLDAIGRSIDATGHDLSMLPGNARPDKVVFVIHTDGEENTSKEFTLANVKHMIEHQQSKYAWEFVFLGANMDAVGVAHSYGIAAGNSMTYQANAIGTQMATASLSSNMRSLRAGYSTSMSFTDSDRDAQLRAQQGPQL